ncbi:MAG: hypothetical protein ACJ798_12350, partial [Phenylobacterium sp.]
MLRTILLAAAATAACLTLPTVASAAAAAALTNPAEVLTPAQRSRFARAQASDKTVVIRTPEEVAATPP